MFFTCNIYASNHIRVFRLQYARASQLALVCQAMFEGQGTFLAHNNMLVVNVNDKELFVKVQKIIDTFDKEPATLVFRVRHGKELSEKTTELSSSPSHRQRDSAFESETTLKVLEGKKASLINRTQAIYQISPLGSLTKIAKSSGLKISGRIADDNNVVVSIWYSEPSRGADSPRILTEVVVPFEQWFKFGGLDYDSDSSTNILSSRVAYKSQSLRIDRKFYIMVQTE